MKSRSGCASTQLAPGLWVNSMALECWCGSGLPVGQCHGLQGWSWTLPAVQGLEYHWPPGIDPATQANIARYFVECTPYRFRLVGDCVEIDCGAHAWQFFRQKPLAIPSNGSMAFFGIPAEYRNWADASELGPLLIDKNLRSLDAISSIGGVEEFFQFRRSISYALFSSSRDALADHLRRAVTKYFEFFPAGSVDFVSVGQESAALLSVSRSLTKAEFLGIDKTRATLAAGWGGRMLGEMPYFDIAFSLFGLGQAGFSETWLDHALLFTFGRQVEFGNVAYHLAYARGLSQQFQSLTPHFSRLQFRPLTTSESRRFTGWYIERLNRLLSYVYHIATFAEKQKEFIVFSPVRSYRAVLTFEQIIHLIGRIIGSDDLFVRKQLTVLLLDALSHCGGPGGISGLFERAFWGKLVRCFQALPANLGDEYAAFAASAFEHVIDEACSGLAPTQWDGDKIRLSDKSVSKDIYAGKYIGALRNTIHGYLGNLSTDFKDLLFINAGRLPDSLPDLVPILFLALVIRPTTFFASRVFPRVFDEEHTIPISNG